MADDAFKFIGHRFFTTENGLSIANEAAVRASSHRLVNETAYDMAFDNLGRAIQAVQTAAERKAARNQEPNEDISTNDLSDGFDFFI